MELRGINAYQGGINDVPELALVSVLVSSNLVPLCIGKMLYSRINKSVKIFI